MKFRYLFLGMLACSAFACTNLEEELQGQLSGADASAFLLNNTDVSSLLDAAYLTLRTPMQDQSQYWAAQEHTTDEVIGPTRGGDWDDNGIWRVLHNHTWDADHAFLGNTFVGLLGTVFATTNILQFQPSAEQGAEARLLRAFAMFMVADGWNQVPFREAGSDLLADPTVLSGEEALDFVISECEAIMNDLPDGPAYRCNKDAAKVLLMKAYLNRGTFKDRKNPTFPAADMAKVIDLGNQIINSGSYSIADDMFDNFAVNNDAISTENIFTALNEGGISSGNVRSRYFCGLHYNQNPSGWNGFTTIADFYNKFEATDKRRGGPRAGQTNVSGIPMGFLVGQQFDQNGVALEDRKGNPLSFTPEVALVEAGNNLEVTGIRVVKYVIDYGSGDNVDNDYVYYRYADVLLMVAEAALRTGDEPTARNLVNSIRAKRGVADFTSLDLDKLIDERGRELYWEGHRRTDLIRFGKFLDAYNQKPVSGEERLLFPIPTGQLSVNPNLVQNPGY
ncbi:MAG: RagB/SusD family nutrient uptake outer membrane protein [Bacteroidetes bacterium]|nr:MAG: RagB/SusD family nutrient uptake outer membrane protein [Bacteroidota bacterium]PTM10659.1 MAG: RagB/SusD family nutrient uptake outer membrane protein [Bacteroidota bacterium]